MPDAGAYVVVDGQTYRVLEKLYADVVADVQKSLSDGSVLTLDVVPEHVRLGGAGEGTLYLQGGRVAAVAVLTGPLPPEGKPTTYRPVSGSAGGQG